MFQCVHFLSVREMCVFAQSNPETIYLAIENLVLLFGLKFLKSYMVKYFQNKQKTSPKEEAKKYKIFEVCFFLLLLE